MRISSLTIGLLSLCAGVTFAERPQDAAPLQFQERLEVRLVQVDAWAVDSGRPVLDLEPSELRLSEDGKPVDILYFAAPVVDLELPAAAGDDLVPAPGTEPGAAPPAAADRALEPTLVAIFLDEAHLDLGGRARTIAALRDWIVNGGLPRGAGTLLVAHERELKVILGRTDDQARLVEALDRLGKPSTVAVGTRVAERRALEQIRDHQRNTFEQQRGMPGPAGAADAAAEAGDDTAIYFEPPCSARLLQYAEELARQVESEAKATLDSLSSFAESLAALRGRKLLLFVSEGMPSRPGGVAFDYVRTLCDGSGVHEGIQYAMDVSAQPQGGALRGQLNASTLALAGEGRALANAVGQVVARANSSGVSIWTFGASGLTASGVDAGQESRMSTPAALSRQRAEAADVLNALAVDTGGRAILESNDFGSALAQFADDLFRAYSLAFVSPRAGDGRLHQIRLETTRPGVRLRYRRSWRDTSSEEELASLVGGALAFGLERPGLGAVATLGRQRGPAGEARLVLRLTLPRSSVTALPSDRGGSQGFLRLVIALRPLGGATTPVRTRTITVETAAGESSSSEPIVHDIALPEIGRGALVAVGLRDELSGEIGIFRLEVGGS